MYVIERAVLEITVGHRPFSEHILNLTDRLLVYSAIWPTEILCYNFSKCTRNNSHKTTNRCSSS